MVKTRSNVLQAQKKNSNREKKNEKSHVHSMRTRSKAIELRIKDELFDSNQKENKIENQPHVSSMRTRSKALKLRNEDELLHINQKENKIAKKKIKCAVKQKVNNKKRGKEIVEAVEFKENDIILGRIRGYSFWPATVSDMDFTPYI